MSFLLDPPLLVAAGVAIEQVADDRGTTDRLARGTLAGFLGVSVPLWLDAPARPLGWIWRPFGSEGPRDFMINSGVLELPVPRRAQPRDHLLAAVVFATYPLALRFGRRWGRRLATRRRAATAPRSRTGPRRAATPRRL
jgi:hypothetical protein